MLLLSVGEKVVILSEEELTKVLNAMVLDGSLTIDEEGQYSITEKGIDEFIYLSSILHTAEKDKGELLQ